MPFRIALACSHGNPVTADVCRTRCQPRHFGYGQAINRQRVLCDDPTQCAARSVALFTCCVTLHIVLCSIQVVYCIMCGILGAACRQALVTARSSATICDAAVAT